VLLEGGEPLLEDGVEALAHRGELRFGDVQAAPVRRRRAVLFRR
jgi:hypothetical protein